MKKQIFDMSLIDTAEQKMYQIIEAVNWLVQNQHLINQENSRIEERMQTLLHNLQNADFPKSPKKFVTELREVRNLRWSISRIALSTGEAKNIAESNCMKAMVGSLKTKDSPKVYKPKDLNYLEFVKTL